MSFEWDDEVVDKFLEEYRQHECLWNPYHRNFTDCYARNEALKKIVKVLRAELTIEDCLKILRSIRKKYLEEQTKNLTRRLRSRSRWLCIVESMLEKIVRDEEEEDVKKKSKKQLVPKVKTLYRHTISSSNRRKDCTVSLVRSKSTGSCSKGKSLGRAKSKKKSKKNSQGKLDKGSRFCSDVEKTKERNSCKRSDMQDCARPQTAWGRQRNNYLDNLNWTTYDTSCARTLECPAYSSHLDRISRVENICRDPCSVPATGYQCQTRSNPPTASCNWEGRKRNTDIQPTPPSVIETRNCRVTRPTSSCSERRTPSSQDSNCPAAPEKRSRSCKDKDKPTMKTASTSCCLCPEKSATEKPKQCEATIKANTESAQMPDVCTKATCPSFSKSTTTVTSPEKRPYTTNIVPVENSNKCVGTIDCNKNVRFECNQDLQQCVSSFQTTPRVAAKFENGVLEAYSQFKVIFPTRPDSNISSTNTCRESSSVSLKAPAPVKKVTQRVQTDSTTRDCAVSVNSSEFLCPSRPQSAKGSCCPNRCLSQRNTQIGTDDDIVEVCYQDNAATSLEAEKTLHDFVLLTPGGKYVPLVRSVASEKMQVFTECCADANRPAEKVPDVCETAPSRIREKQMPTTLDDEKCDSSTTKLLLRCLEQMLNLEEQEEKGKSADTQEDPWEPCKHKELTEKAALGCSKEKPTNPRIDLGCSSPRGKLTQNFLEILKCALELDHGKKADICDDDGQKQDKNCDCDDAVPDKKEPPTPENSCDNENRNCAARGDRMIRCSSQTSERLANKSEVKVPIKEDKSVHCQELLNCTQPIKVKESPCRDAPIVRSCAVDSNSVELSSLQPRTTSPNSTLGDKQVYYKKTVKQTGEGHSRILEKTVAYKASTSGTCIDSTVTKDTGVQEEILSSSRGTQCEPRSRETKTSNVNSVGTQKRDTVLEYLVGCANRTEKICPVRQTPRTSKSPTPNRIITRKSRTNLPPDQCQQDNATGVSYVKCNQFYRSYVVRSPTRLTPTPQENVDRKLKEYHRRVSALKKICNSDH
ncbi:uncharacterized protein LOC100678761 isoform X1 [Nasonia vitripennis]|uniref:MADF domain-containing protein n=2 Tax=Nasonia vitripennis TaxID=7425 RepID=A0A7M7LNF8_NASVI|nr:uncharacterized protein LOC100678761 isoform X1 [Nasonia vitripennis]